MAQEIVVRNRVGDHGDQLRQNPVLFAERIGVGRGGLETVEPDNEVDPIVGGGERGLDFDDDAVGAVSVRGFVQILARQFENARLRLHGQDSQAENVAEIAQAAPIDRADAARAASDKAAERGGGVG